MPYELSRDVDDIFDPDALPRVIGREAALRRGMSRHAIDHRVSTGQWRRVLPRTYLTADTFSERDQWSAVLTFAGQGAALSGAAALRASDVARVRRVDVILVLVPPRNRTRSIAWVQVRRTHRPITTVSWTGPRRVEPARATADLALTMRRPDDVRALVARVVQHGHCTVGELGAELEAGPRAGSLLLRRALTEVGFGAASAPEAVAASILRRFGVGGFVQNAPIRFPDGSIRYVDFYWPELRACLEIDSVEFHFDRAEWAGTWDRHLTFTTHGYSVIHRPPSALRDARGFARDVSDWLAGRARELGLSA